MAVNAVTGTLAPSAASTAADKNPAQELSDRFLKLLVAQMNNQDPLNPLDNAQVTTQMAQINTVTGINGLNDTVQKLLDQFAQMQGLQAAQLTGRSVLVTGNELRATAPGSNSFGVEFASAADSATAEIRDSAGALVRTLDLGQADTGISRFTWDGNTDAGAQAPAGRYTLTIKALAGGKEIGATPLVARTVEAVSTSNGSTSLVLAGGGSISYGDIKQIL